jgi:hypothetical protein
MPEFRMTAAGKSLCKHFRSFTFMGEKYKTRYGANGFMDPYFQGNNITKDPSAGKLTLSILSGVKDRVTDRFYPAEIMDLDNNKIENKYQDVEIRTEAYHGGSISSGYPLHVRNLIEDACHGKLLHKNNDEEHLSFSDRGVSVFIHGSLLDIANHVPMQINHVALFVGERNVPDTHNPHLRYAFKLLFNNFGSDQILAYLSMAENVSISAGLMMKHKFIEDWKRLEKR